MNHQDHDKRRVTPGIAIGLTALFVALGGSAIANHHLLGGKDILNESITGLDIKNASILPQDVKAVTGNDIVDGSIETKDLAHFPVARVERPTSGSGLCESETPYPHPSVPTGSAENLYWIFEEVDFGAMHTNGCGQFQPGDSAYSYLRIPITGQYEVGAGVVWNDNDGAGTDGERIIRIVKNDEAQMIAEEVATSAVGGEQTAQTISTIWRFNAGDRIHVQVAQNSGESINLRTGGGNPEHRNYFYAQFVGR